MNLGLGLAAGSEDPAGMQREINANFDVINAKALGIMEWTPIAGTATGAGTFTFDHHLGRKPDMLILFVNVTGITWYVSEALKDSWTEYAAAASFSGACNFYGFVGKYDADSLN